MRLPNLLRPRRGALLLSGGRLRRQRDLHPQEKGAQRGKFRNRLGRSWRSILGEDDDAGNVVAREKGLAPESQNGGWCVRIQCTYSVKLQEGLKKQEQKGKVTKTQCEGLSHVNESSIQSKRQAKNKQFLTAGIITRCTSVVGYIGKQSKSRPHQQRSDNTSQWTSAQIARMHSCQQQTRFATNEQAKRSKETAAEVER